MLSFYGIIYKKYEVIYLRKCFLCILLCLIFISGCEDKEVSTIEQINKSEQTTKVEQQEVKEELKTKEFSTPNVYFLYPDNFEIDREAYTSDTIVSLVNSKEIKDQQYTGKRIDINVQKLLLPEIKTLDQFKDTIIKNKLSQIDNEILDEKSYLNENIAIFYYLDYNQEPFLRDKMYIWTDGNSKFYVITVCADKDNVKGMDKVSNILEKSLKFN